MDALNEARIEIPEAWEKLSLEGVNGVHMVVGAPDVGKTTFARYLFQRILQEAVWLPTWMAIQVRVF